MLLPKGNELKEFLQGNLKGYMKKSFKVFTNPNYQVDKNSKIYKIIFNIYLTQEDLEKSSFFIIFIM